MNREIIRVQFPIFGGFFFVFGYGLLLYQKWLLPLGSPSYMRLYYVHGSIMVFFGIVPALFMGLGHYVMPSVRGGQTRFPQLESISLYLLYSSALFALGTILLPGTFAFDIAISVGLISPMICCVNFIATAINPPSPTRDLIKLWYVKWTLVFLSFILFINFLFLEIAFTLMLKAKLLDSGSTLVYARPEDSHLPLVWKHVFWFAGHPEVTIFLLSLAFFLDSVRFVLRRIAA